VEGDELTVVVVEPLATHVVCWQVVQDGGMSEQTSSEAHTGHEGTVLGQETQPRRKTDSYETVEHQYHEGKAGPHATNRHRGRPCWAYLDGHETRSFPGGRWWKR
jgi:hypothetical protein